MSKIHVRYHVAAAAGEIRSRAGAILREQAVEVPPALVSDARLESEFGRVADIQPLGRDDLHAVDVEFESELACGQIPQLLNLVWGNVSLVPGVRLVDLVLPDAFLAGFGGPAFGVQGVRKRLGVQDRPLFCSALKPRGLPVADLAAQAGAIARGGGDLIKDDHNLVDPSVQAFRERVRACHEAVQEGAEGAGGAALYLPYLCAPTERLDAYLEAALDVGVEGFLVAPMVLGLDRVRALAASRSLLLMGHPSFTGSAVGESGEGLAPAVLWGTLYRLCGIDVSIVVHSGGRFSTAPSECRDAAARMRSPMGEMARSLPCPAGGMTLDRLPELWDFYGRDVVVLVGGDLLRHAGGLEEATRRYVTRVADQWAS